MNKAEILQFSRFRGPDWHTLLNATDDDIVAFAEAIAEKEREACIMEILYYGGVNAVEHANAIRLARASVRENAV